MLASGQQGRGDGLGEKQERGLQRGQLTWLLTPFPTWLVLGLPEPQMLSSLTENVCNIRKQRLACNRCRLPVSSP